MGTALPSCEERNSDGFIFSDAAIMSIASSIRGISLLFGTFDPSIRANSIGFTALSIEDFDSAFKIWSSGQGQNEKALP